MIENPRIKYPIEEPRSLLTLSRGSSSQIESIATNNMELHRNKELTTFKQQQLSNKGTIENTGKKYMQQEQKQRSSSSFPMRNKFILAALFLTVQVIVLSLPKFKSSGSSLRKVVTITDKMGISRNEIEGDSDTKSLARNETKTDSDTNDSSTAKNTNFKQTSNPHLAPGKYVHPNIIYGTIHMAKTGGTSLNGMLANKYERVCGHKGYTYDAYRSNERAIKDPKSINMRTYNGNRDMVDYNIMEEIGYENCDYISHEINWNFWVDNFPNGTFHGIPMELHVPCRDPIDHLMSQCNYKSRQLDCDGSEESFLKSIDGCFLFVGSRYKHKLKEHFQLKCFDFKTQFTDYVDYMSERDRKSVV